VQAASWVVLGQKLQGCVIDVWRRGGRVVNDVVLGAGGGLEGLVGLDEQHLFRAAERRDVAALLLLERAQALLAVGLQRVRYP